MAVMVFRPRVDWWVWAVVCFALTAIVVIGMVFPWWLTVLYGVAIMSGLALGMVGIWYAIEDKNIVVYQFFRPHPYPIAKIKEIRYNYSVLAAPALSFHRLSIKFTDRSVLKSSMPLDIAPKDMDGFVKRVLEINPDIVVKPRASK